MDESPVRVIGSSAEPASPPDRPRVRAVTWLSAGVLIGLLVGYAFFPTFNSGDASGAAPGRINELAARATPDPLAGATALADLVPQLEGSLVVILGLDDFELVTWSAQLYSPQRHSLGDATPSDGYTFPPVYWDAASSQYAFVRTIDADETVLYVGYDNDFAPLARDVKWFAWHTSEPGRLAWTTADDDGVSQQLFSVHLEAKTSAREPVPIASVRATDRLVGWDRAGYILSFEDPALGNPWVRRIDQSGAEIGRAQGTLVESEAGGSILLMRRQRRDSLFFKADAALDELVTLEWAPPEASGRVKPAALATDGRIAFTTLEQRANIWRLEVWTESGEQQVAQELPGRVWDVSWSPDGRFVVMPGFDSVDGGHVVLVYDTGGSALHTIGFENRVSSALIR